MTRRGTNLTCPRCGGHLTITSGAVLPSRRYVQTADGVREQDAVPTVLACCDRCEFVRDLADPEGRDDQ